MSPDHSKLIMGNIGPLDRAIEREFRNVIVDKSAARVRALESLIRRNWNKFSHEDHAELERMGVRFTSEVDG